jgi:hypothetical protein
MNFWVAAFAGMAAMHCGTNSFSIDATKNIAARARNTWARGIIVIESVIQAAPQPSGRGVDQRGNIGAALLLRMLPRVDAALIDQRGVGA